MINPTALVQRLGNYCNILRDDGLSYSDYVDQLTFLLFLKMADEQAKVPYLSEEKRRDAASTLSRHSRKESERFKSFTYEEQAKRDKVNLDMLTHAPRAFGPTALRFATSVSHASRRLGSG